MFKYLIIPFNIIEHVVDNYIYDKVQPKIGSIVYCDFIIAASIIQHSGIYVGNGKIVHLNGKGLVEKVTPAEFTSGLLGLQCGPSIYISCNDTEPVGCSITAGVAEDAIGETYEYSIIKYNCHQFVSECIDGCVMGSECMNSARRIVSTLTGLKIYCRINIDSNNWRVWDR